MSDLSSRMSLREIVGGVAPGLMVIASFIYVAARIPTLEVGWNAFGTGWSALLVIFVLAYGVGTMLKSGTEFAFERVTQMGQLRVTPAAAPNVLPNGWAERLARMVEPLVKHLALYLGGGKDIAALNRDFRDSWHRRAVIEGGCRRVSSKRQRCTIESCSSQSPKAKKRSSCARTTYVSKRRVRCRTSKRMRRRRC